MRGMPLQNVAILMGHADINMTANVYYDASDRTMLKIQYRDAKDGGIEVLRHF